jgi:hypothetical protein
MFKKDRKTVEKDSIVFNSEHRDRQQMCWLYRAGLAPCSPAR